ncbi:flagellar protein FlaG [Paenibacillus sp. JSM ZJ436]|uniref:flagellar protein FlaG n=1 Tax=Paenibacillus sp. JSM ZJ436 TaxID=3376190 RepID=UPI0037B3070F
MQVQFSLSATASLPSPQTSRASEFSNTTSQENTDSTLQSLSEKVREGSAVSYGEEQLVQAIERAVKSMQGPETTLDISIHEKTKDIMVKILDKQTGEIIREIPREQTLDLVANMMEIAGILFDRKV